MVRAAPVNGACTRRFFRRRTQRMQLSLILPTYNERGNIQPLVRRIEDALKGTAYELIFVDDSTDGTDVEIDELAPQRPHIVLIHRRTRSGLATAILEGVRRAQGDVICVLDADLQHPPEIIPLLLQTLESTGADLVVASRNIPGGSYGKLSVPRRLASRVATALARALLSRARRTSDPMSGFFIVRTEAVRDVDLKPIGYKILLEILVRGHVNRIAEVPYCFELRDAGASKLNARQQWEYLLHLLRLVTVHAEDLRFLSFGLVGATGVAVNTWVLWVLATRGIHYALAGMTAAAAATTWNFFLNDAFTWRDHRSTLLRVKAGRYLRYCMVTGTSSLVQVALLLLLTKVGVPLLLSNLLGIGIAALLNFKAHSGWTWREPASSPSQGTFSRSAAREADPAAE
jgi:dolichol-phosphate mannosyltransferase